MLFHSLFKFLNMIVDNFKYLSEGWLDRSTSHQEPINLAQPNKILTVCFSHRSSINDSIPKYIKPNINNYLVSSATSAEIFFLSQFLMC